MLKKAHDAQGLDFDWGRIEWLVSEELGNSRTMTFGRVTIKSGQSNPVHRHPNCDEILHLLQGQLEHSLGDDLLTMEAGDTISIPAGVWHNARASGADDAVMLISFSSSNSQTESRDPASTG